MNPQASSSLRTTKAALGMRWFVLVVILFGVILSSIGGTNSHGLAAIAAPLHTEPSLSDDPHGHAHEAQGAELAMVDQSAEADHPHHGADHSHDNVHALPVAWGSASLQLPSWWVLVRPWVEMIQASRLERPPMV